jgi:polyisoprenoid-binding protein YceI
MVLKHGKVLLIVSLFTLAASACGLLQDPEEASGSIEVIPLEDPTDALEIVETEEVAIVNPTESSPVEVGSEEIIFAQISQDGSQVRFELDEDLRGERKTVVGITNQVSGEIAVNPTNITESRVGVILINARTLLTDNDFRNRAIQNNILDTGEFEFITFSPSEIVSLPSNGSIGEEIRFFVIGDLTIRDITQSVTFDVMVIVDSETRMVGSASAIVTRADYDLNIPSVPNVANVEEEVELYIDFVANRN